MARLLADENFPLPVTEHLRRLGHDVTTLAEYGMANQAVEDDDVLALATRERRALLTHNRRHFLRLHKQGVSHPGIVVCTYDPDFERQAARVADAAANAVDLTGQLVRVNRPDR